MSANHLVGNRNSTPETSTVGSNLRPPSSRATLAAGHQLRASDDWGAADRALQASRANRPASEVLYNQMHQNQNRASQDDNLDKATQQWIADIDQYENTLDEMAAATLDQDFKDELSAIEQWFRVLSEAERTAALYALLQQTTQVQIRFFIGVLQQMSKSHPMSGVLSPASFDPMSNRLSNAMNKLGGDASRNSLGVGRPPPTPGNKRNSGLDPDAINQMFPVAAAAIAKERAEFTQQTGVQPTSNRNSTATTDQSSMVTPTIAAPREEPKKEGFNQAPPSPWGQRSTDARPKSSSGQQPMGQFTQSSAAGIRSPRNLPQSAAEGNVQNATVNPSDHNTSGLPLLSPYGAGASWASMVNTPMAANFPGQPSGNSDLVAAETAMRLQALSTFNNRFQLDNDVRKYRRARSTEGEKIGAGQQLPPNMTGQGLMRNELGQILTPQQAAALQAQQLAAMNGGRSRPNSPGRADAGQGAPSMNVPPQNNGFLSVYNANPALLNNGMAGLNLGQYNVGAGEGYLSDASEINRGRSPRGRRGSSKPPEDPTDVELLKDIPAWLRSLRLHKYTDNLKDMNWKDLVQLDDAGLEKRGVNALGARRKMLKVFEQVREAQGQGRL